MQNSLDSSGIPAVPVASEKGESTRIDFRPNKSWIIPGIAGASVVLAFWPLFRYLDQIWFGDDTYYAHGAVVPICSAMLIHDQWPKLKQLPVKGVNWAIIPLLLMLYVTWFALRTDMHTFESALLIGTLLVGALFVAGWQWLKRLAIPILYLAFGLPILDRFVDNYTTSIQLASTKVAFLMLQGLGLDPVRLDTSTILMNHFSMDVGVACSGMKLLLAVTAISTFFVLVAKLKWWGNAILLAAIVPLSLLINSTRIALIGWVGNSYGQKVGEQFHDYSGYICLAACFFLLLKLTRVLGWK